MIRNQIGNDKLPQHLFSCLSFFLVYF